MTRHLLVTNDYPPKVGGIQNYLWELWRRLPSDDVVIHTTPYAQSREFDAQQTHQVIRSREFWLVPHPLLVRRTNRLAAEHDAEVVLIDPALPAGLIGPHLQRPYGVVLHGAEVAIPARVAGLRLLLQRVLSGASGVIAAGNYPASEAQRRMQQELPTTVIAPGVDINRFVPQTQNARRETRLRLGLRVDAPLVLSVSRLIPRKGMDTLIRASVMLRRSHGDVVVAIAGTGRDERRLTRLIRELDAPVQLLGRVADDDLPALYGCADVFSMLCRNRWRGLEQEGFGIVFVEAAAAGVPAVAGRSGGADEAVSDGQTGIVVEDPRDVASVANAISDLLSDDAARKAMGRQARQRAEAEYDYDVLAVRLSKAIDKMVPL